MNEGFHLLVLRTLDSNFQMIRRELVMDLDISLSDVMCCQLSEEFDPLSKAMDLSCDL